MGDESFNKSSQVKSSQVKRWNNPSVISAHSLPPLLASGAHSIGCRTVVCCLWGGGFMSDLTNTRRPSTVVFSREVQQDLPRV